MRLAPLALAALVLALAALALALVACTGGEPPAPTPTAASTPAPTAVATPEATPRVTATAEATATAEPTPTATPEAASTPAPTAEAPPTPEATAAATPEVRSGLDLVEATPRFRHRTFEDGEVIDWEHGIFVLDAETGRTEGYAVAGLEGEEHGYDVHRGGWITTRLSRGWGEDGWILLLNRETGRQWRWLDTEALTLLATSEEHLLFDARASTGRFVIANSSMERTARFSVADGDDRPWALFSPDGRNIVLKAANKVYLVPVATGYRQVLFDPPPRHGERDDLPLKGVYVESRQRPPLGYAWIPYEGGVGVVVTAVYEGSGPALREKHYFSWDGEELPAPACPGTLSPDGRYAAVASGAPYYVKYVGYLDLESPWPSVTVTDAETCAPIFRVRSAYTDRRTWSAEWLPTSGGFVVGVYGGYAIAQVGASPSLLPLPAVWPLPGPIPAPTGGGRYFGYGSRVYDAAEGRWRGPPEWDGGPFWWGASHRELWFHSWIYWGEGGISWLLRPPKIEYPPFNDEIAFRVARTGSCLRLREEPGEEGRVLDCLPDGERLLFADSGVEVEQDRSGGPASPHSSIALEHYDPPASTPLRVWVYVRTEDGAEGWVSHGYLAHD